MHFELYLSLSLIPVYSFSQSCWACDVPLRPQSWKCPTFCFQEMIVSPVEPFEFRVPLLQYPPWYSQVQEVWIGNWKRGYQMNVVENSVRTARPILGTLHPHTKRKVSLSLFSQRYAVQQRLTIVTVSWRLAPALFASVGPFGWLRIRWHLLLVVFGTNH